jgi:hypothetical protein
MSTGQPREDAKIAFDRQRRRRTLSRLASRIRFEPDDVSQMLPFDEVVAALGATSRRAVGEQVIALDSIVGTVDRRRGDFDRAFRPSPSTRGRWERIAEARKRGEAMPPIDVYQIGDLYFVQDGHHRVSVARAMRDKDINANVIVVQTRLGADRDLRRSDLPLKTHERVFHERVPLPAAARARIELSDEWRYAQLATLVESWGYRASLERERPLARPEMALLWFQEDYEPMVVTLREAGLGGGGSETERYLRVALLRFLILQSWDFNDDLADRIRSEVERPSRAAEADTMTHQILKEMRD